MQHLSLVTHNINSEVFECIPCGFNRIHVFKCEIIFLEN